MCCSDIVLEWWSRRKVREVQYEKSDRIRDDLDSDGSPCEAHDPVRSGDSLSSHGKISTMIKTID